MAQPRPENQNTGGDVYSQIEEFGIRYKNLLIGIGATVLVVFLLFFAFKAFYVNPNEEEAQTQMFKAQSYFESDSFNLALNGDGNFPGFLNIINDYKYTPSANLAHYYAGISFLRLGNFEAAVEFLEDYSTKDGIVGAITYGALGDAYMELGNTDKGISNYKKAANHHENEFTTPMYLMRLALAQELQGNFSDARKHYERIRKDFPESQQGTEIDRYIARIDAQINS